MALRILDKKALRAKGVLFSNVHLLRLERAGKFPQRFNVGDNRIGWIEEDVDAWIIERIAASKLKRQTSLADDSDSLTDAPADSPDRREAIIAKIRALMAKTLENGATEREARAAAEKVDELIAKYAIELWRLNEGREDRRTQKSGGDDGRPTA